MALLDELKKLDEQREKLIAGAKKEALDAAEQAVASLNELGFNYRLVEGSAPRRGGARRTGIKAEMMKVIKGHQSGIDRAGILERMGIKGDKSAEQSVSNALANAKKKGELTQDDNGKYKAVPGA